MAPEPFEWSDEDLEFIEENVDRYTWADLSKIVGRPESAVHSLCRRKGWGKSPEAAKYKDEKHRAIYRFFKVWDKYAEETYGSFRIDPEKFSVLQKLLDIVESRRERDSGEERQRKDSADPSTELGDK